ncbi:uncharacterized protein MICPUCDRAFT_50670 [Micromonas pusilla CCMP1545]|jgi:tRNA-splicing endonuclease subunit Sen34|uniref:tRNA-intron lyase n=1 Tax=Micromonas pusilla (strain CCMP1545) TaxID=564608 RepID=C1MIR7_MICPC|nr:uncharacterized protein MICPUCDRAFT_50670 [Micromonas pusilla CCMP1545]EEH60431.1 predicted protein [Micromonas pusilla CCMP1545]|eukprot:XP_003055179.1 predicted protein [Micromonas pusilla CCMP1545]
MATADGPIRVQVSDDDTGLVWSAEEYHRLRTRHRVVGALVGGLPGFRQQDSVHGLPARLSPEEVTLALHRGWVTLYVARDAVAAAATAAERAPPPPAAKRPTVANKGWGVKPKGGFHNQKRLKTTKSLASDADAGWERVLNTSFVEIPLRAPSDAPDDADAGPDASSPEWSYPRTDAQRRRFAVFSDLHARGLTMTAGVKFGSDYLAYPGEPMAYHACFTVKVCDGDERMRARELSAASRMSHAARKNLVLATATAAAAATAAATGATAGGGGGEVGDDASPPPPPPPPRVMKVSYVTVTPDIEQSKGGRVERGG